MKCMEVVLMLHVKFFCDKSQIIETPVMWKFSFVSYAPVSRSQAIIAHDQFSSQAHELTANLAMGG